MTPETSGIYANAITHRRRWRDSTVELSHVGVGDVSEWVSKSI